MEDVRQAAQERASRPKKAPVGASFESERQRSKNALVKQIASQDGRNVRMIAAATERPEEERILRVAAYCRVSTDDIDQALSIHLQIQQYMKKIKENPNWKYAGCYVDDGFSGTNTDHRQGFQKLMKDCMDGKIDMVITKAVSRFARNLMDCIGWVEALQNHDPPVRVFFEQENLDTMSQTSGIILFVLAMRFRGQISQGLLLPVGQFPEIPKDADVGDDVTELLGVRKWEIEERATTGGTVIGTLPYDIPHTDETRVQEEPALIQAFAGLEYYISTKMDGSSHSIGIDENGFHVTGHNYEYKDDGSSSFYKLVKAREYQAKMEDYMKALGLKTLTIQGELCAPGIQQNRLRLTKPEWYVFTIRENGKRVGLKRMLQICEALDIIPVPIEEVDTDLPSKYPTVEALLARADGDYPNGGKKEGIVIRPTEPVFCPLISASLSMKVVSNKYLLKNDG